jgi:MoaA/NifB/PqqE/SkfB family radical SAM enzyme
MPNQRIFCNVPWYGLQIYWDGSLGFCCQEAHKSYPEHQSEYYNVKNISIKDWHNSDVMKLARLNMFEDKKNTVCTRCYQEEELSTSSKRPRENQKSVIFTKSNFDESYQQSPHWEMFEHSRVNNGDFEGMPVDLHIDLGNYCNLTCKMCRPEASSSIASQYVKWGIQDAKKYIGTDWTRDNVVWNRVLDELASIPKLKNIHFMGGETLITKRFEDFVDFMIARKRFDLNFSFVTNATSFNQSLLDKLKKFQRVGIEISIETTTEHNEYQRQGTDTQQALLIIDRYL